MKDILILQNITREGPGILAEVLRDNSITFDIVDLHNNEHLPPIDGYKALVVLGGPDSANDTSSKIQSELAYIREAMRVKMPYLGICLGLQLLVKAMGGSVIKNEVKEIGFIGPNGLQFVVEKTDEGKRDQLLNNLPDQSLVFQLHGETVALAEGMVVLATGEFCHNQIVRVGDRAYGIQSHFELTSDMLEIWAAQDPDLTPIGAAKLRDDFAILAAKYTETGKTLVTNFLIVAQLLKVGAR